MYFTYRIVPLKYASSDYQGRVQRSQNAAPNYPATLDHWKVTLWVTGQALDKHGYWHEKDTEVGAKMEITALQILKYIA
jgi:hypothetical protein